MLEYRNLTRLHTANYRSHRKVAVIDGKIGYVGGLNLDQDQLDGGKYFDSWRDTHLRIRGEAALALVVEAEYTKEEILTFCSQLADTRSSTVQTLPHFGLGTIQSFDNGELIRECRA